VSENSGDFRRQSPLRNPNRSKIHGMTQIHDEKNGQVGLSEPGILQNMLASRPCGGRPVYGSEIIAQLVFRDRLEL